MARLHLLSLVYPRFLLTHVCGNLIDAWIVGAFKDLYRYGMPAPGKVTTLSPDHPNHFSLVGQTIYAQVVYKPSNRNPEELEDSWWLTWYNEPAAVSLADLERFEKDNEEILANAALAAMGDTF